MTYGQACSCHAQMPGSEERRLVLRALESVSSLRYDISSKGGLTHIGWLGDVIRVRTMWSAVMIFSS